MYKKNQFFQLYDDLPLGIVIIDQDFKVLFWNKNIEYNSQINKSEIEGKNLLTVFPGLDNKIFKKRIDGIFIGGSPAVFSAQLHKYLIPCKLKDGSFQAHHTIITALPGLTEGEYYAAFSIKDVTEELRLVKAYKDMHLKALDEIEERKKVENVLVDSESKLRELNKAKDKFFSILAHDLRNPFIALLGYSEMLMLDIDELEKEEIVDFSKTIFETSKNVSELLENLLSWGGVQSGRIKPTLSDINIFYLTEKVISLSRPHARLKKISLINEVDKTLTGIADQNMIETVLRNLVTNSIKFTCENGTVTIGSTIVGDFVKVMVSDTGIGMNESTIKKLFKIDESVSTEGTNEEKGSGLGLILCKEIVEKNGGTILAESEIGKGSRFIFTVPLSKIEVDSD